MSENHPRPYSNVTEVVGTPPLIRLNSVARDVPGTIYVKCEFMNPLLTRKNAAVLVRDAGEIGGILTRYDLIRNLMSATG